MHTIKQISAKQDYKLIVVFTDGKKREFDAKLLINKYPQFKALENIDLFLKAKVAPEGQAVIWNEQLDISAESIYNEGKGL